MQGLSDIEVAKNGLVDIETALQAQQHEFDPRLGRPRTVLLHGCMGYVVICMQLSCLLWVINGVFALNFASDNVVILQDVQRS
jgi:hypothetical protein